ncbi:MAG: ADP-heptose--LPS heptosyltransferase 2 [Gammaproteobacteria bacterium]|nr:MAG: ADP-heptose--LPS heptosyltransferase 2 [Gammaproteobacteria bacterium]
MIKQNKKVLVIRCGLLGDTVDATSVIEPLLELYGKELEIHWVSKPNICELFKHDRRISKVYTLRHTKLPFIFNKDKLAIIVNSLYQPYDLILNLEIGKKFNDIVRFCRAENKIGMPYDYIPDDIFKEHRVDHQLRILDKFFNKYNKDTAKPSIVGKEAKDLSNKFPIKKKYIIFCPTNSHVGNINHRGYRSWPENNWGELINKVLLETSLNIVLVGNKDEKKYFKCFYPLDKRVYNLAGTTSIPELITIMKNSECVVATDSGSAHIAGAVAKNIISIHGPTNYYQSSPYSTASNNVKIASLNLNCSPCYDTDIIKSCKKNRCMHDLSAENVMGIIKDFNL